MLAMARGRNLDLIICQQRQESQNQLEHDLYKSAPGVLRANLARSYGVV